MAAVGVESHCSSVAWPLAGAPFMRAALIKLNESLKKDMGVGGDLLGRKRGLEGEREGGEGTRGRVV